MLKPLFIDFGKAKKIDPIIEMYDKYKFREILGSICAQGCFGKYNDIMAYPDKYGWASGSDERIFSSFEKKKLVDYEKKVKNSPNELVFFKNAPGVKRYFDLNLSDETIQNLNQNIDGENGFMNLLIMARNKSRDKINEFKLKHGIDSEIISTHEDPPPRKPPKYFFSGNEIFYEVKCWWEYMYKM